VDIEILEVDRTRTKTYGLNLSDYALGAVFSPVVAPGSSTTTTGTTTTTTTGQSTPPSAVVSPPPFNLNTVSRGVTTSDFYLAVPTAIVRFLESDNHTKIVAKPQLRGAEGSKLTYSVGQQVPIVSTSYTPIATGGAGVNPLSSYTYKSVGVNIEMTPRVSLDGEIILDLTLDDSALGPDKSVAGVTVPSFIQRTVTTRLRLHDGESNLLAGLLQTQDSNTVQGFPGVIRVPFFKQVFSGNNITSDQTEIVMLLTPHIVRTQELTESDLRPIYIGSQQNLGIGGAAAPHRDARGRHAAGACHTTRGGRGTGDPDHHRPQRRPARGAAWFLACAGHRCRDAGPGSAGRGAEHHSGRAGCRGRECTGNDASCHAAGAAGRSTSRSAANRIARYRFGTGPDLAARHDVPRRRRTVHGPSVGGERLRPLDRCADAPLRSHEASRAISPRGELHADGRCRRRVHAAGERWTRRYHPGALGRCDRRIRNGTARGHPL